MRLSAPPSREPARYRLAAGLTRGARAVLAGVLVVGAAACDPCAGVVSCVEAPRLGVSGQIVERGTPTDADRDLISGAGIPPLRPASGVRVEVVRVGGVALDAGTATATTDGTGWWQVTLPAREEGTVTVDVAVTPPGGVPYRVGGLALRTSRTRGDGNVLGRWTREPYVTYVGELFDAGTGAPVDGARITAVRRGGVAVEPTANTRMPMVTFAGGRFIYDVRPLADGPLVLDFTIERDGLPTAYVRGETVPTLHEWLPVGPNGALSFRLDAAGRRVSRVSRAGP